MRRLAVLVVSAAAAGLLPAAGAGSAPLPGGAGWIEHGVRALGTQTPRIARAGPATIANELARLTFDHTALECRQR